MSIPKDFSPNKPYEEPVKKQKDASQNVENKDLKLEQVSKEAVAKTPIRRVQRQTIGACDEAKFFPIQAEKWVENMHHMHSPLGVSRNQEASSQKSAYEKTQFHIKQKILQDYFHSLQPLDDKTPIDMLLAATNKFSKSTIEAFKKGIITSDEKTQAEALHTLILSEVDKEKKEMEKGKEKEIK